MRYIRTTNRIAEFIESDSTGKVLNIRGFQFGELYYRIQNSKVTFYLDDNENPWRNDVWTADIPLTIDEVVYETEDEVSAALHKVFDDSLQEQIDELNENLAAEEARAQEAEEQLDDKIDDETSRAISAETHIQDEVTALSGTVATFDNRITTNTNAISALTNTVNAEIARSTGKDGEHDALISGLTNSLNNEIARAISAETSLHNDIIAETNRATGVEGEIRVTLSGLTERLADDEASFASSLVDLNGKITALSGENASQTTQINTLNNSLNTEIQRATSADTVLHNEIVSERDRALAAESAMSDSLNAEITRSTSKDASQDALISGLSTSLQNEISRATGVENSLRNDLNTEVSRSTSADTAMAQRITAVEIGKADANSVYTKQESDAKYATKDYVSGLTDNFYTKNETNALLADKADKVSAVSTALYNSQNKTIDFKNINGAVIASVDARDFIKDGMVDTVTISGSNLVITFNTDAGKEPITIPLTDIFNPANYYDKTAIDNIVSGINTSIDNEASARTSADSAINDKITAISGSVNTINSEIQTISGEIQTISGDVLTTGDVQTQIDNSISGKQDTLSAGTNINITNNVISATDTTYAAGDGITITGSTNKINLDIPIYKGSGMLAVSVNNKQGTSGSANNINGMTSFGAGFDVKTSNNFEATFGTANNSVGNSGVFDGSSGKTLFSVGNGTSSERHNAFEIRQNGDIYIASTNASGEHYEKPMIKLQDALENAGGSGVTSGEVQTMIDNSISGKQDTLTAGNGIDITNNVISATGGSGVEYSAGTNVQINNHVISATDTTYTAGDGISISNSNVISTVTKFWCGTEQQWAAISGGTLDANTIYMVH